MPIRQDQADMNDPEQFAAWVWAAGIPDARGERYPNQPMIPAPNFPAVSAMLWALGFRHHAELQTQWVKSAFGPDMNFQAWGLTDVAPVAAEMLVDQSPEQAAAVAARAAELALMTPEKHAEAQSGAVAGLLKQIDALKAAQARMDRGTTSGGEPS